jgi:adenine C2-methylase RlmN of 23S rRNA A2503 and tRNA A37
MAYLLRLFVVASCHLATLSLTLTFLRKTGMGEPLDNYDAVKASLDLLTNLQSFNTRNTDTHAHTLTLITIIVCNCTTGMGEPLDNYDAVKASLDLLTDRQSFEMAERRITVSTVGIARRIRQLAHDAPRGKSCSFFLF